MTEKRNPNCMQNTEEPLIFKTHQLKTKNKTVISLNPLTSHSLLSTVKIVNTSHEAVDESAPPSC